MAKYINKEYLEIQFKNFAAWLKLKFVIKDEIKDLASKDDIPTVGNATVTVKTKQEGAEDSTAVTAGTFTTNQSEASDIIIPIPKATELSWENITDKPTMPDAAHDAKITIKKNGTEIGSFTTDQATPGEVNIELKWADIADAPSPMTFKGALGTGTGEISALPAIANAKVGDTYIVNTAATYAGTAAKVGDLFVANSDKWVYVPSGDDLVGVISVTDDNGNIKVNTNGTVSTILAPESAAITFNDTFFAS